MAATVVKLAAIPAAIGLASIRVYAMSEDKSESVQLSPRELSIYSQDALSRTCLDEQPGALESGLGVVRVGLQPYVRAVKNAYTSVKFGAVTIYTSGQDTYEFLRNPSPGFIPRVTVITVSGLAGLILARKGSHLKRLGVPLGMATLGTAVCYPTQTVGVVKVTGQKMYAASQYTTSSLVSLFKSKQKEVTLQTVSFEQAPPTLILEPDVNEAKPPAPAVDQAPTSEPVNVEEGHPSEDDPHPSSELTPAERSVDPETSAATGEEDAVEPVDEDVPAAEDSTTVEVPVFVTVEGDVPAAAEAVSYPAPVQEVVSAHPAADAVFLLPPTPEGMILPLSGEAAGDEFAPVDEVAAPLPLEETPSLPVPVEEATSLLVLVEEATPLPVPVEEATPHPVPVEEATSLPVPVEEAAPLPVPVEEATPTPVPVEEATSLPVPVEEATPTPVPVEDATSLPISVEEATTLPVPVEEATPPPVPVEEATPPPVPVEEATPPPVPVEEATPPSVPLEEATLPPVPEVLSAAPLAPVEEESSVIVIKTAGKPTFSPDPKLVDLGQSSPEDEDLYSKRG